jgi:hypothetical protein
MMYVHVNAYRATRRSGLQERWRRRESNPRPQAAPTDEGEESDLRAQWLAEFASEGSHEVASPEAGEGRG